MYVHIAVERLLLFLLWSRVKSQTDNLKEAFLQKNAEGALFV